MQPHASYVQYSRKRKVAILDPFTGLPHRTSDSRQQQRFNMPQKKVSPEISMIPFDTTAEPSPSGEQISLLPNPFLDQSSGKKNDC